MVNTFRGYQRITQYTQLIYISKADLDEFKTKKLLGLKVIEVKAHPVVDTTQILELHKEGVETVEMIEDTQNGTYMFRFKTK